MNVAPLTPLPWMTVGRSLRRTLWAGGTIFAVFFAGFGGWAAYAPLSGAAIAPAVISPDGEHRTVQHLEGGIVRKLMVHEGSTVEAGQELLVLDPTSARASREVFSKDLKNNLAMRARLIAERDGASDIRFPPELTEGTLSDETVTTIESQKTLFANRAATRAQKKATLEQQVRQLDDQIVGLNGQIDATTRQLWLIHEELKGVETLLAKGLERKPRQLELQRTEAELIGSRAQSQAAIAKSRQQISEIRGQIDQVDKDRMEEVGGKLAEVEATLQGLREKVRAAGDVMDRTVITAPVAGTVVQLKANTIGGVIGAGQTILEIVPRDDELLVDAHIAPNDIEHVKPDLPARVVMTGYSQRNMPRLMGKVRQVSADRIVDSHTNQAYYIARIELPAEEVREVAPFVSLKPGMPAEVMVITNERTFLDYLIEPLVHSIRRSFRES
jgi:HlyD family secretion protein